MSTGLPRVEVSINPNNIGNTLQTEDDIAAMVLTGVSVSGKIQQGEPTLLISLADAESKGITEIGSNSYAYSQIQHFYNEAVDGAKLWVMLVASSVTMEDMVDKDNNHAKALLANANPPIKLLAISRKASGTVTLANGLDADVDKAIIKAQELAEYFLPEYKECSIIVDAKNFNGKHSDLKDYNATTNAPYVTAFIGSVGGSKNAAVGLYLGRLAKDPVQRNPAHVKTGSLAIEGASFTSGLPIAETDFLDAIHNKGFAFFRTITGKAGYYFSDAQTCAQTNTDLNSITLVRVITKARLLAYKVFVEEILEEIPVNENGQLPQVLVKAWEAKIETAITQQMIAKGEASGVVININSNQDIIGTSSIAVTLKIQPVGYARYINISLGFTKTI